MQSSTRANLEENYNYHARLAEFHKQRMDEAAGGGEGGAGEKPPGIDNTLPGPQPDIDNTLPTTPPVNVDVPLVMGDGFPGGTLTCTMGNWDGEPESYQYNWKSDGQPVKATTGGDTYQVLPEDVTHSITCVVVATNSAGSTEAPPSNAVVVAEAASQQSRGRGGTQRPAPAQQPPQHIGALPRRGARSGEPQSRDQTLFALHDDVAKQLRSALDAWQDAPSQQQMRDEQPVARRASRATAREAARTTSRATRH